MWSESWLLHSFAEYFLTNKIFRTFSLAIIWGTVAISGNRNWRKHVAFFFLRRRPVGQLKGIACIIKCMNDWHTIFTVNWMKKKQKNLAHPTIHNNFSAVFLRRKFLYNNNKIQCNKYDRDMGMDTYGSIVMVCVSHNRCFLHSPCE